MFSGDRQMAEQVAHNAHAAAEWAYEYADAMLAARGGDDA